MSKPVRHNELPKLTNLLIICVVLSFVLFFLQNWVTKNFLDNEVLISVTRIVVGFTFGGTLGVFVFWVTLIWAKKNKKPNVLIDERGEYDEKLNSIKKEMAEIQAFSLFLPGGALFTAYETNKETENYLLNEVSRYETIGNRYLFLAIAVSVSGIWFIFSVLNNPSFAGTSWVKPALSQLAIVGVLQILAVFLLRASAASDKLRFQLIESVAETKKQKIAISLSAEDFIEGRSFAASIPAIVGSKGHVPVDLDSVTQNSSSSANEALMLQRIQFLRKMSND